MLKASIEATKKECNKEMEQNERLVSFKTHIKEDIASIEKQSNKSLIKDKN